MSWRRGSDTSAFSRIISVVLYNEANIHHNFLPMPTKHVMHERAANNILFQGGEQWVRLWVFLNWDDLFPAQANNVAQRLRSVRMPLQQEQHNAQEVNVAG